MLRVRDLAREFGLRVLVGEAGLRAAVRGVQISDLHDPTPWLSRGELLLTSGAQLADEGSQREYVALMAGRELAGIGLGAGGLSWAGSALVRAAEEYALPVLEVPRDVPFIAIAHSAAAQLTSDRDAALRRALTSQEELEQSIHANPGLETLVNTLSELLDAAVMVFDSAGHPLARRELQTPLSAGLLGELRAEIRRRAASSDERVLTISTDEQRVAGLGLPVSSNGVHEHPPGDSPNGLGAWLVAVREQGGLSDLDRVLLRQAVPITELELLRRHIAEDRERRRAAGILEGILSGELSGEPLRRRLEPLGLIGTVAAIVVRAPEERQIAERHVEAALAAALRRESAPALVASTADLTCGLVPGLADDELFELASRVKLGVDGDLGVISDAGAGRAVDISSLRRTIDEARGALDARALARRREEPSRRGGAPDTGVATFRDLGSYQLLLALQGHEALELFCDSILGPIEAMESSYGGELLKSLQVFIETNGQWERAARQLYCHRHTLRYRIRKIEELTGRDLENAHDRIEFYLALRARGLLS